VTYSTDKKIPANLETITAQRAMEIIDMNKRGEKPLSLQEDGKVKPQQKPVDLLAGESLTRFDKSKKKKKQKPRNQKQPQKPREKAQDNEPKRNGQPQQ